MEMFILKHLGESDLLQFQSKCCFFFQFCLFTPPLISEMYIRLTVRRGNFVPNYFEKYASKKVALSSSGNLAHKKGSSVAFKFDDTTISLADKSFPAPDNKKIPLAKKLIIKTKHDEVRKTITYRQGQRSLNFSSMIPILKLLSTNCSRMK